MKLWVDDVNPAPEGYVWAKSVNEAISWIVASIEKVNNALTYSRSDGVVRNFVPREEFLKQAARWQITLIDIDDNAGDFVKDGGHYIRLLDWLEERGLAYPIRIHTADLMNKDFMRMILIRNGWNEVC